MHAHLDITGKKFGHWLVLASRGRDRCRHDLWLSRCDCCGEERVIRGDTLRDGRSTSCGKEPGQKLGKRSRTHGLSKTRAYACHQSMMRRCYARNDASYPDYGERGIGVIEHWHPFEGWYADMGDPPPGLSIHRVNNDGNYEPSNCVWASPSMQAANRRRRPINVVKLKERIATGGPIKPRERNFILACIDTCAPPVDAAGGFAPPPF